MLHDDYLNVLNRMGLNSYSNTPVVVAEVIANLHNGRSMGRAVSTPARYPSRYL